MLLALCAAVAASLGYGISTIMQAVAARRASGLAVIVQPLVLGGFAVDGLSWLLTLVALNRLPLFVVQSIVSASLVVVVLLASRLLRVRLRRLDVIAVAVVIAALVVLALGSGEQPAATPPPGFLVGAAVAGGLLTLTLLLGYRRGHPLLLASVGGLGYGLAAIAARAADTSGSLAQIVWQPMVGVLVVGGVVGTLGYLRALERGPVGSAAAVMSVLEVIVPGAVGLWVLGDEVRGGWVPAVAVAGTLALAACVALATSPANREASEA